MEPPSQPQTGDSSAAQARVHAFGDDALGHHDAVALAAMLRRREVSRQELIAAAIARAGRVAQLNAIVAECFAAPRTSDDGDAGEAPFAGVPTFVKDIIDLAGLPTRCGSAAMPGRPAAHDEPVTRQLLDQGFVALGKTHTPEFGFSPTTEFQDAEPTRNPWNPDYSSGGSSGGSAALVAAGVVPLAHGDDGGGSIRIPAANTGLVGLKPTRGRLLTAKATARMPLQIVCEGVLTRTVRDTAHFYAATERRRAAKRLPPIGLVEGPGSKRLRIAVVFDSIAGVRSCPQTRAAVERIAHLLERLGHEVTPIVPPVPEFFLQDFKVYWALIAFMVVRGGRPFIDSEFDAARLDGLTKGLDRYFRRRALSLPLALVRLRGSSLLYARQFRRVDAVLSPVTSHMVPRLGHLHPGVAFDELFDRISRYTAFTPLNNATGGPAIAVPVGLSLEGLPIGVHFSAAHGAERTLLELAYTVEAEVGFPRIDGACLTGAGRLV